MIALVFTVCLVATGQCHEERILLDLPALICPIFGQEITAEWAEAHPAYRVEPGWKCEPPRSERHA